MNRLFQRQIVDPTEEVAEEICDTNFLSREHINKYADNIRSIIGKEEKLRIVTRDYQTQFYFGPLFGPIVRFAVGRFPSQCGMAIIHNIRITYWDFNKCIEYINEFLKPISKCLSVSAFIYTLTEEQTKLKNQLIKNGWEVTDKTFINNNTSRTIYTLIKKM